MRTALILIPALLAVAGCATDPQQVAARDAEQAALVPAAETIGKPEDCVTTRLIRSTDVHNDSVIDFKMVGGEVYRNILPASCSGLGFEERFSYKTSIGRLCSVDTITVLRPNIPGPTCGLGEFQPVRLVASND